jgi:hypothetical protein
VTSIDPDIENIVVEEGSVRSVHLVLIAPPNTSEVERINMCGAVLYYSDLHPNDCIPQEICAADTPIMHAPAEALLEEHNQWLVSATGLICEMLVDEHATQSLKSVLYKLSTSNILIMATFVGQVFSNGSVKLSYFTSNVDTCATTSRMYSAQECVDILRQGINVVCEALYITYYPNCGYTISTTPPIPVTQD